MSVDQAGDDLAPPPFREFVTGCDWNVMGGALGLNCDD